MIEGAPFPAIEKVYDPSSKKCNGRITPQAPIVITGHHLDMLTWDSANLYLVSSVNDRMLIECGDIHKYSDDKVYTTIPDIDEGEYFLALMILMKDNLRVALVTGHIPLAQVASKITVEDIVSKLRIFNQSLRQDFGIVRPRIAVLALNPHAGDAGLLGKEEEEIIIPAIQEAEKKGVMPFGPYAADGFFGSQLYDKFDGVLAMYHDQGLAPFKTLAMDDGVNYTAGLSIVRTSPAHGTAYDIAGQNVASEESFRQALYAALDIYRNRIRYREATANPLRKQYFDKGGDNEKLDLTKEEDE